MCLQYADNVHPLHLSLYVRQMNELAFCYKCVVLTRLTMCSITRMPYRDSETKSVHYIPGNVPYICENNVYGQSSEAFSRGG